MIYLNKVDDFDECLTIVKGCGDFTTKPICTPSRRTKSLLATSHDLQKRQAPSTLKAKNEK